MGLGTEAGTGREDPGGCAAAPGTHVRLPAGLCLPRHGSARPPPEPPGTRTHRSAPLPRLPIARERRRGQSRSPGGGAALKAAEAPAGPRPGPGASPEGGARRLSPHPSTPARGVEPPPEPPAGPGSPGSAG